MFVSHLRFADDIVILAELLQDFQRMLDGWVYRSSDKLGVNQGYIRRARHSGRDFWQWWWSRGCTRLCLPWVKIAIQQGWAVVW